MRTLKIHIIPIGGGNNRKVRHPLEVLKPYLTTDRTLFYNDSFLFQTLIFNPTIHKNHKLKTVKNNDKKK